MKNLNEYIKESLIDEDNNSIEQFLKDNYNTRNCTYNIENNIVNVNGVIKLTNKSIDSLTDGEFEFGVIKGSFDCSQSNIASLDFGPKKVTGSFNCSNCQLQYLYNAPKEIGESFDCSNNPLMNLMDGPQKVGEVYNCSNTDIVQLSGMAKIVDTIICDNCERLKSFKGAPSSITGDLSCLKCTNVRSLEQLPKKIDKLYYPKEWDHITEKLEKYNIKANKTISSDKYYD